MPESGPDHQTTFRSSVLIGGQVQGLGEGRSKKEAEQQAARAAWSAISRPPPAAAGSAASQPG